MRATLSPGTFLPPYYSTTREQSRESSRGREPVQGTVVQATIVQDMGTVQGTIVQGQATQQMPGLYYGPSTWNEPPEYVLGLHAKLDQLCDKIDHQELKIDAIAEELASVKAQLGVPLQ